MWLQEMFQILHWLIAAHISISKYHGLGPKIVSSSSHCKFIPQWGGEPARRQIHSLIPLKAGEFWQMGWLQMDGFGDTVCILSSLSSLCFRCIISDSILHFTPFYVDIFYAVHRPLMLLSFSDLPFGFFPFFKETFTRMENRLTGNSLEKAASTLVAGAVLAMQISTQIHSNKAAFPVWGVFCCLVRWSTSWTEAKTCSIHFWALMWLKIVNINCLFYGFACRSLMQPFIAEDVCINSTCHPGLLL